MEHGTDDPAAPAAGWAAIEAMARRLPAKTNLVVPKTAAPGPPPYAATRLGRARGARRQYRCDSPRGNLHIKEYADRWVVHVDAYHPGRHIVRHLLIDHGFHRFHHLGPGTPVPLPGPVAA